MLVRFDRYLMLQLWQFHLEHIQCVAVVLKTVMVGGGETETSSQSVRELQRCWYCIILILDRAN